MTGATRRISVGVPPGPGNVELARLAGDLGYERIWLYDSAGLYQDIWVWLALIGEHADIDLGTAVLVPNLRHVMTTAAAIATIEGIAPGRLACGFGTGATARWVLGKPALSWATTRRYLEQLRALLRGEAVEVDGAVTQMIHLPELAPARPIDVPLLLSAIGPKGKAIAQEIADGVITIGGAVEGVDWCVQMVNGTVLGAGEDLSSPRVQEAAGPWFVVAYHGSWQAAPTAVDGLPLGAEWRAAIEAERTEAERHLAVHEGHVTRRHAARPRGAGRRGRPARGLRLDRRPRRDPGQGRRRVRGGRDRDPLHAGGPGPRPRDHGVRRRGAVSRPARGVSARGGP